MKRNIIIIFLLLIAIAVSSCTSTDVKKSDDVNVKRILKLKVLEDNNVKLSDKKGENKLFYEGDKFKYVISKDRDEISSIYRKGKPDIKEKDAKTVAELMLISYEYLIKINEEFSKMNLEKEIVQREPYTKIKYQRKSDEVLKPNYVYIELDDFGNFISYIRSRTDSDVKDSGKYVVTKEEVIDFAKKSLFDKYKIEQKYFEENEGAISLSKYKLHGRNAWKVDISFTDDYVKGGTYYIDCEELKVLKFSEYK